MPQAGKMVAEGAETPSPDQVSELLDLSSKLVAWAAIRPGPRDDLWVLLQPGIRPYSLAPSNLLGGHGHHQYIVITTSLLI